ncbi:glycoprotein 3-alpha-L-fucosyltransferase A-like isoform X2 [Daktulosphaira vitifoliae]|uniref:glycoprotein 3-alpha-L-fucosyltransferase A-like isoform X2 n=1 Tax=Daktulosphaira vitifoliae TaxID=58002 RepID=UPI0021A9EFB2|nr:glycoprotein 3-alpha-L-fucosyltransferase A-like isoform X2 [Daktulosphaira vitifoliae]
MPACKCYDRPRTTQRNFWFVMLILSLLFIIIYFGLRSLFINHQEKVTNVSETTNNINHYEVSNKHPWRLNKTIMEGRKTLNNYSRRLVWPEELSNGDRIMEQILFVPSNYNRETAPIKKILLYNGIGYSWEIPRLGQEEFIDCPVSSCSMTTDKSLAPLVEAILFKHKYNGSEHIRPPNQIWIIYFTEGPYISPIFQDNNVFNWTATYRMDSDIPNPYSYWYQYNEQEIKIRPKVPKKNYASGKIKQVAWFVSDCKPFNNRSGYAHELSKHISVDIYGKCGPLKCPKSNKCFLMLKNTYKFYLAFENAHCMHYITEKLYTNAYNCTFSK